MTYTAISFEKLCDLLAANEGAVTFEDIGGTRVFQIKAPAYSNALFTQGSGNDILMFRPE